MSDQIKKLAPLIWSEIQKANNILLHCHPSPDGDSVGSALATMNLLTGLGKQVTVISGDSEIPIGLSLLPGYDKIQLKNFLQVDLTKFDLFISLDSSSPNQISQKGDVVFPPTLRTINIDHHISNTNYAQLNLVEPKYPAVCQILYDVFKLWTCRITPEIAICLFVGLYTDTGGFKHIGAIPESLDVGAALVHLYPDFPRIIFHLENSYEPQNVTYLGLALSNIETYFHNNVALSAISLELLQNHDISVKHTEKMEVANTLKSVVGWNIGVSLVEHEPNIVKVSLRTRDHKKYDVSKIAVATGTGGGHPVAAGATIQQPMPEAIKFLLETIQKVYPDLGQP